MINNKIAVDLSIPNAFKDTLNNLLNDESLTPIEIKLSSGTVDISECLLLENLKKREITFVGEKEKTFFDGCLKEKIVEVDSETNDMPFLHIYIL